MSNRMTIMGNPVTTKKARLTAKQTKAIINSSDVQKVLKGEVIPAEDALSAILRLLAVGEARNAVMADELTAMSYTVRQDLPDWLGQASTESKDDDEDEVQAGEGIQA